jgi:quercetin dioxygenase-like cupin family protein
MRLVKVGEGQPYSAPHHFNYWSIKKIVPNVDSRRITVGVSHFLPGGGAEMSSSKTERVYFCIEGRISVKGKDHEFNLEQGDMIYINPNEDRSFEVSNTKPATILVIMVEPD